MEYTRAVIFANGELADGAAVQRWLRPDDFLIAADGGLHHLRALGLQPHLVIGDLDSLSADEVAALQQAGVQVQQHPAEKDETDLELAIQYALQQGFKQMRVVAALGGRLDQTLANLALLEMPGLEGVDIRLDDGREEILIIRDQAVVEGQPGDTVSLLAMNECTKGIVTSGLKYALNHETLCPNRTRGISNEMTGERAEIRLLTGRLLCMHTRRPSTAG
ncbi:MAG: thiamine pyrophosphokinase [Bellilinea sp.]|nr:MAG: thiamine pyrophosphokinase [Bellilinea sp.]